MPLQGYVDRAVRILAINGENVYGMVTGYISGEDVILVSTSRGELADFCSTDIVDIETLD